MREKKNLLTKRERERGKKNLFEKEKNPTDRDKNPTDQERKNIPCWQREKNTLPTKRKKHSDKERKNPIDTRETDLLHEDVRFTYKDYG